MPVVHRVGSVIGISEVMGAVYLGAVTSCTAANLRSRNGEVEK